MITVKELIKILENMPADAPVVHSIGNEDWWHEPFEGTAFTTDALTSSHDEKKTQCVVLF